MRRFGFSLLILLMPLVGAVSSGFVSAHQPGDDLRSVDNNAFKPGEYLKYRIHYGIINAGVAELMVKDVTTKNDRPVYHMVGLGRSVGMAEWFFRTRDRYESFIDTQAMVPWEFIRDVDEGGYIIQRHLVFNHYDNTAKDLKLDKNKSFSIIDNAQDMLSTFYYARCLPTEGLKVGQELPVNMFLDHEDFSFRLRYLGSENVKTEMGKIRCKKFVPVVQEGRVFRDEEGLTLWVTDDANKIPVRLEAELAVGSVKMDLVDYRNTRHPINFL